MDASAISEKIFPAWLQHYAPALLIAAAWLVLYAPVYSEFSQAAWTRDENGHALFIMAICLGAAWARLTSKHDFYKATPGELLFGVCVLAFGLALYMAGRAGRIDIFSSSSQVFIAGAITLCMFGLGGVKKLWFPLALSLYLIIWPGWAVEAVTAPLKRFVSESVSEALFALGLPIAHSGAIISAGSYELLVADACAGLNSLIALTSIGAVYLFIVKRRSWKINAAVIAALIPLAIFANIIRVGLLILITYYFGYDAGQGFLHETAGFLMFATALGGVFAIDAIAARFWEPRP